MPKKITLDDVTSALKLVFEYGEQEGYNNILDKAKLKEVQVAEILGHTLFKNASGGNKETSEQYGADAIEPDGSLAEYKSITLTEYQYNKFLEGRSYAKMGVYNGAYSFENINKYKNINHYFSVHYNEKVLAIVKVDTEHVIKSLTEELAKRIEKAKVNKVNLTTNCNAVKINVSINKADKGELVYAITSNKSGLY